MYSRDMSIWKPLGWALALGASLALAGCGGESTTTRAPEVAPNPPPKTDITSKPAARATKGPGGSLVEGGELSAQERRALKQKERQAGAR
jgi:hypothetical protein